MMLLDAAATGLSGSDHVAQSCVVLSILSILLSALLSSKDEPGKEGSESDLVEEDSRQARMLATHPSELGLKHLCP